MHHVAHRTALIQKLEQTDQFDLAIIGGGATGLGIALDASLRGFRVVLLESHDFAKGTSSRATKLIHGGVRYLAQGNIGLVREALTERATLLRNAPHLTNALPFVMPTYRWWEKPFYGLGLKAYDVLAGSASLGRTEMLNRAQTLSLLPTIQAEGLLGGVKYWDAQFDDARLALALARSAQASGALVLNYCAVTGLLYDGDKIVGLQAQDVETGKSHRVPAACVVNATGVWVDAMRQQDAAAQGQQVQNMIAPSQGVHVVVDRRFTCSHHALMIPKTADGRVLFAVPWLGKTILGTTDTPRQDLPREPLALQAELDFILGESARYLSTSPTRQDIKSVWVGLRPLVKPAKPPSTQSADTKTISREHTVAVAQSGLVTVTGGKWTTYRSMAEDVLQHCFDAKLLPTREGGQTANHALQGAQVGAENSPTVQDEPGLHAYGSDAQAVMDLPGADHWLAPGLSEAMVRYAVKAEYARTVEDVLARRSRLLFLDAKSAQGLAGQVAAIMQEEGVTQPGVDAFVALAQQYQGQDGAA